MKITLVSIGGKPKSALCDELAAEYLKRSIRYAAVQPETFASEERFLLWAAQLRAKGKLQLALFDPAGKLVSSEDLAAMIGDAGVAGVQQLVLAIGPADGWSAAARTAADRVLSFGRITLPHELARTVAAEQLYRAFTILSGHPYHSGH